MLATVRACWRSPRAVPVGLRNSICSIQRHHCDSFRPSLRAQHSPAQRRGNASGRPNAAAGSAEPAEVEAFILPALETEAQVEQERKCKGA